MNGDLQPHGKNGDWEVPGGFLSENRKIRTFQKEEFLSPGLLQCIEIRSLGLDWWVQMPTRLWDWDVFTLLAWRKIATALAWSLGLMTPAWHVRGWTGASCECSYPVENATVTHASVTAIKEKNSFKKNFTTKDQIRG